MIKRGTRASGACTFGARASGASTIGARGSGVRAFDTRAPGARTHSAAEEGTDFLRDRRGDLSSVEPETKRKFRAEIV